MMKKEYTSAKRKDLNKFIFKNLPDRRKVDYFYNGTCYNVCNFAIVVYATASTMTR